MVDKENLCKLANLSIEFKAETLRKKCCQFLTQKIQASKQHLLPGIETVDKDFVKRFLCESMEFKKVEIEEIEELLRSENNYDCILGGIVMALLFLCILLLVLFSAKA